MDQLDVIVPMVNDFLDATSQTGVMASRTVR
jgi:hypothetical protein